MRNLEKGILLAELINKDLPSLEQIKNLVRWIREQDCYLRLLENMDEIKNSPTLLAQSIYEEFKAIDLDRVNSIEDGLISYAKILYLCQISTPNFYVNPLLVLNKKERDIKLDEVIVNFNNHYLTLGELRDDKDASFNQKYEFIKNQVAIWEKDVYERILKPTREFKYNNPRNLPKIRVMSFMHYLVSLVYLAFSCFIVYGFVTNHQSLNTIFKNFNFATFTPRNYFFIAFLVSFGLGLLTFAIRNIIVYIKEHKYIKCRKIIIEKDHDLYPYIHKCGNRLQDYILSSWENRKVMNDNVFKYSSCLNIYEYVLYLYNVNTRYKKIKQNRVNKFEYIMVVITIVCFALTIASILF